MAQATSFRKLSVAITVAVILLAIALIHEKWLTAGLSPLTPQSATAAAFWTFVTSLLTPALYNCALLATAKVFGRMDKGQDFSASMSFGLAEIGYFLMLASASAIIFTPSLQGLIRNNFTGLTGVSFSFGIEGVTIGLLGLMLVLLAKRGRALKTELEQFV